MTGVSMEPFKLEAAKKDYLWGGTKLKKEFGINSDLNPLAEAWMLSAHHDGISHVSTGELAGIGLRELFETQPELFGEKAKKTDFPILVKLIDAKQKLSIQVHPDDAYVLENEGELGKTEMWVVLQADQGAFLYYGFSHTISSAEYKRRILDGTLPEVLYEVPVKAGDVFFVAAGTIHAIGEGIVIAEIQENSNTTYRVFDYGRTDANGKTRPLHIEKALEVTTLTPASRNIPGAISTHIVQGGEMSQLASCPYFRVRCLHVNGCYHEKLNGSSFVSPLCIDGCATLVSQDDEVPVSKGEIAFVPANIQSFSLSGNGVFLLISLPEE